jgi:EAL domain-containing protein (putative c-di-GMP-specific phosphodiesterase class I)
MSNAGGAAFGGKGLGPVRGLKGTLPMADSHTVSAIRRRPGRRGEQEYRDLATNLERKLAEEKDAFLTAAAYHIGTPLAAVVGLSEILGNRTRDFSAGVRSEMIDLLGIQARETEHVVNNVVAAARLDMGVLEVEAEPVDLRAVVETATLDWTRTQRSRLTVTGEVKARGDVKWITQIVSNLLRNAVAYGGESVSVQLTEGFNKVVLEVTDDGEGVVDEDLEKIFDRYYADRSADGENPSLGLGLSVARRLARSMGGDIRYSRFNGESVFELSLKKVREEVKRRHRLPDAVIDPLADRPTSDSVSELLASSGPTMVYQPIVDMRAANNGQERVLGYESLARFPHSSPPEWFEAAGSAGMRLDLELVAMRTAIAGFAPASNDAFLALNLSDATLISSRLTSTLIDLDPGRIVLELSESARIKSYEVTRRAVDALRDRGIRLAVDDVGADEIDLWHILRLQPDIIKIDRRLVADAENVRRNNALIRGITVMASDLGIMVVAEAVETEKEHQRLIELGVQFGQGYLFGRPQPLQWKTKVLTDHQD